MANTFGTDILIQSPDPKEAALFYVAQLGFAITDETPEMISLHGPNISLFIERGSSLGGPVLEVMVGNVEDAKRRLTASGCVVVKDEPDVPRCYVQDPNGLTCNLTTRKVAPCSQMKWNPDWRRDLWQDDQSGQPASIQSMIS